MKRVVVCLIMSVICISLWAESVDIGGVKYSSNKNGTAKCKAGMLVKKGAKGSISISIESQVRINNIFYTVTEIEENAFKGCKSISSVVIPNTISKIGECAFWDCKFLRSVVIPENAIAEISVGSYGFGKKGIFSGCVNLTDIKSTAGGYPKAVLENALYNCSEVPFFNNLLSSNHYASTDIFVKRLKFSEYAKDRVKAQVEAWQKKKEYETTAQWRERVTEQTRKVKVEELVNKERNEYISKYSPATLVGNIGMYDADYNIFPIEVNGLNTIYVRVPIEEAPNFKENWLKVKTKPIYGIVDDKLGVLTCSFMLDGKTYHSADAYDNDDTRDFALNLSPLELDFSKSGDEAKVENLKIDNSIDLNIPSFSAKNTRTFAVIIGNENYERASKVQFAHNDAVIFGKYCNQTLGIPMKNLRRYKDATFGSMLAAMKDIKDISDAYNGDINVIFYYAGHGIPSESDKEAYLLPVDADGSQTAACYSMKRLYEELGGLNAKSVVVFLDACFSGAKRGDGMLLAARGVAIKPRSLEVSGNTIVFSAASGEQTAFPYKEKGHGMFTYFLLEKLRDAKGDVTLGDLCNYIKENVKQQSVVVNGKLQTPMVQISSNMLKKWSQLKLK